MTHNEKHAVEVATRLLETIADLPDGYTVGQVITGLAMVLAQHAVQGGCKTGPEDGARHVSSLLQTMLETALSNELVLAAPVGRA